jgi:PAS domain S-box-containing protein
VPQDVTEVGAWRVGAGAFLAAVLDCVVQPIWAIDHDGLLRFANPAALAVLGYDDLSELEGRPAHATVHYKHPDGSPFALEECPLTRSRLAGETIEVTEDHWVRRDGSFVLVSYSSAPIATPGGWGAVVAFTDVDERRRLERALHERDIARVRADELNAARRRIIEAGDAARQRLTRDLHDGAQQRLVTAVIDLQMAQAQLTDAPASARALVTAALEEAEAGLDDLRELAAGVHPAILTTRGLAAAVDGLVDRLPIATDVDIDLPARLAEPIETSAYFFVSEALTNAVKHANAGRAEVRIAARDGTLVIDVADDGQGGVSDRAASGTGLAGLADRIAALGGIFSVSSPAGVGTTLHAEVPLTGEDRADRRPLALTDVGLKPTVPHEFAALADGVRVVLGDQEPTRHDGGLSSVLLSGFVAGELGWQLHRVRLAAGTHHVSGAHARGVRELARVHRGRVRLGPLSGSVELCAGDFVEYAADVPHVYQALDGEAEATFLAVDPRPDGPGGI